MASGESEFKLTLVEGISGPSAKAGSALDELRAKIGATQAALKNIGADMDRLKGATEKVKTSKGDLSRKMIGEQKETVKTTGATHKSGLALRDLSKGAKEGEKPIKGIGDLFSRVGKIFEGGGAKAAAGGEGMGAMAGKMGKAGGAAGVVAAAVAAAAVAFVAITVKVAEATVAVAKWVLISADASRTAGLWRESVLGGAANSAALTFQIDQLARVLPTSRAKLQEMALSLWKTGIDGQILVDSMAALGHVSEAMGEDVAGSFRRILEANKLLGRFQLPDPREMRGWGVSFDDIAKQLSTKLGIGLGDARARLRAGGVKLADGAAALRAAVEKNFGAINLRKALTIDAITGRFHENIARLFSGINIEPVLVGLSNLANLLSKNSVLGYGLEKVFKLIGDSVVQGLIRHGPLLEDVLYGVGTVLLQLVAIAYRLKIALVAAFDNPELKAKIAEMRFITAPFVAASGFALDAASGQGATPQGVMPAKVPVGPTGSGGTAGVPGAVPVPEVRAAAVDAGKQIPAGMAIGVKSNEGFASVAIGSMGALMIADLKKALGIKSPSRVFAGLGANTALGFAAGIETGTPAAVAAVGALGDAVAARGSGDGADAGGGGVRARVGGVRDRNGGYGAAPAARDVTVNVTINAAGGIDPSKNPSFLAELTRAIENALLAQGLGAS